MLVEKAPFTLQRGSQSTIKNLTRRAHIFISKERILTTLGLIKSIMLSLKHWWQRNWERRGLLQRLTLVSMGLQLLVCARFGLECIVYNGAQDMERQALHVFRLRLLGAEGPLYYLLSAK